MHIRTISQIREDWTFSEDGVTPEVHLTARVDVDAGFSGEFVTNDLTPSWRRIPMFVLNYINGSVQWLGVPAPLRTDGPPGLIISWLLVLLPIRTGEANLVDPM